MRVHATSLSPRYRMLKLACEQMDRNRTGQVDAETLVDVVDLFNFAVPPEAVLAVAAHHTTANGRVDYAAFAKELQSRDGHRHPQRQRAKDVRTFAAARAAEAVTRNDSKSQFPLQHELSHPALQGSLEVRGLGSPRHHHPGRSKAAAAAAASNPMANPFYVHSDVPKIHEMLAGD